MMVTVTGLLHRYLGAAWIVIFMSAAGFIVMALDRSPPFQSISYVSTPAKAGGTAYIDAKVSRDLTRRCDVSFSRFFIDKSGTRWEVTPMTYVSAKGLQSFDTASKDRLRLPINIQPGASVGPAKFIVTLAYTCNVLHNIWPIDVVLEYDFEVLP